MDILQTIREELTVRPTDEQVAAEVQVRINSIESKKQSIVDRANNEIQALENERVALEQALGEVTTDDDTPVETVEGSTDDEATEEAQG